MNQKLNEWINQKMKWKKMNESKMNQNFADQKQIWPAKNLSLKTKRSEIVIKKINKNLHGKNEFLPKTTIL